MKPILSKIKFNTVKTVTRLGIEALDSGIQQILRQTPEYGKSNLTSLEQSKLKAAERFMLNMNACFDLLGNPAGKNIAAETLETTEEIKQELKEPALAMEGMIAHARNVDIQEYISFSARMNSLSPDLVLDETNNPLDPEQIGNAFVDAVRILDLSGNDLLTLYRAFNMLVFHNLEGILVEANKILVELGVLPDLDIKGRSSKEQRHKRSQRRPTMDRESRAFSDGKPTAADLVDPAAELFATLQKLLAASAGNKAAADVRQLSVIPLPRLIDMLSMLQTTQLAQIPLTRKSDPLEVTRAVEESISMLAEGDDGVTLSAQAAETVDVIDRLFLAISRDNTLPTAIRDLIVRSQIAVMKVALADPAFFSTDKHPVRTLLDEVAQAGVNWIGTDNLASDPLYQQVFSSVSRLIRKNRLDDKFVSELLDEFLAFQRMQRGGHQVLEQRIAEAEEANERLQHIHDFVTAKINERLLKQDLDVSIRDLLDTHVHQFLVKLVLREGPGGAAWRAAMNTIDILIWTVQADKQEGDRQRFDRINAKLMTNLEKVLNIAEVAKTRKTRIMRQLKQVQEYTFHVAAEKARTSPVLPTEVATKGMPAGADRFTFLSADQQPPLPANDRFLQQVDNLPIGVWLEFQAEAGQGLRCTLAARIDSIDRLYFVNAQGVKVVETGRMPLARELKAGSVKIVSEGSVFNRAMETVISELRETLAARAA